MQYIHIYIVWAQKYAKPTQGGGVRLEDPIRLICLELWVSEINFHAILWSKLGVSNQTRYPTNPSNSARKPTDPSPVTVSGGSPSPKPNTGWSDDEFEQKNLIPNRSDRIYTRKVTVLHRWVCFAGVLVRLVEIWAYLCKIHRDLVEIQRDLFEICLDLFEIRQDLGRFGPISTKIWHSFENLALFRKFQL